MLGGCGKAACPVLVGGEMIYFVSEGGWWLFICERWMICFLLRVLDGALECALLGRFDVTRGIPWFGEVIQPSRRSW